jgi:hypothetical protein
MRFYDMHHSSSSYEYRAQLRIALTVSRVDFYQSTHQLCQERHIFPNSSDSARFHLEFHSVVVQDPSYLFLKHFTRTDPTNL